MAYSRKQYNAEIEALDEGDQLISILVAAGKITGWQALDLGRELEAERKRAKARLFMVRAIIAGRPQQGCTIPGHLGGCVCGTEKQYFGDGDES